MERCRGDLRSPLLFIIKQNLVYRTQWVPNPVCGGADPHTPGFFCVPKRNQKGTAQTPRRLWYGSMKCSSNHAKKEKFNLQSVLTVILAVTNIFHYTWIGANFWDPHQSRRGVWTVPFPPFGQAKGAGVWGPVPPQTEFRTDWVLYTKFLFSDYSYQIGLIAKKQRGQKISGRTTFCRKFFIYAETAYLSINVLFLIRYRRK